MEQTVAEEQQLATKKRRPTLRGVPDVLATIIAIPAIVVLIRAAQPGVHTFGAAMFGIGLILMLGMSGLYHTPTWSPRALARLQRLDHAGIFLLIAGSYTPFCLSLDLPYGDVIVVVAWLASGIGVLWVLFVPLGGRALRAGIYVVLGAALLPATPSLYEAMGPQIFALVAGGGALYIMGAGVYVAKRPNPFPGHFGSQEVFHLFVFAAAISHYIAVWKLVTPVVVG